MAGQRQDSVPLAEGAMALGLSQEAARKRLQRGTLDGYKVDGAWFVVLPPLDIPSGKVAGRQGEASGRQDGLPVTPAEVERAIEATAGRYMADFAGLYDRVSADVAVRYEQTIAAKDDALATKDETIAELRRRAEVAEVERDALRSQAAPQPLSKPPPLLVLPDASNAPMPADGFWRRLRRVFGGA